MDAIERLRALIPVTASFYRLVSIIATANRGLFAASLCITVLLSQCPALLAYISKLVIDSISSVHSSATSYGPVTSPTIMLGTVYLVALLFQHLGQTAVMFINETLTENGSRSVHLELMRAAIRIEGLRPFENPAFHQRRAILENHALYLPMNALRLLTDLCSILLTMFGVIVLLVQIQPLIPFVMILFAIPDARSQMRAHQLAYEGVKATAQQERLRNYYKSVLQQPAYAKEVRLYRLQAFFVAKYTEAVKEILRLITPIRSQQIRESLRGRLTALVGVILPYMWAVQTAVAGRLTAGDLLMTMTAIAVIQQQLARTAQTLAGHQEVITVMKDFVDWVDTQSDIAEPPPDKRQSRHHHSSPRVSMVDVWFKYEGAEDFVLKGINLDIPRGTSLAIVGRNGCGKTTLAKLLCRLYDPDAGSILIDDINIRDLELEALRNSVGFVFQDFVHYQMTLKENIALRESDAPNIQERLQESAQNGGINDFLAQCPQSFDTALGRELGESASVELSGGQWQRVALARAFFRDAGFLILDEPTASLDADLEAQVYKQFEMMTRGRSTLLISHRLATVRLADRIAVIDGGRVVEYGDHESLMASQGVYNDMYRSQAERYRTVTDLAVEWR